MSASDLPRPVGKIRPVRLTGALIPWAADDQPAVVQWPGSAQLYLPCFTSASDLIAEMAGAAIPIAKIKRIEDGPEFLSSIPGNIIVILDLCTERGRVRFTQVLRD